MRKACGIVLSTVLAAGLLVLPGALVSPASAGSASAMALTLDSGDCEPLARRFLCSVAYSGAVPPVTVRWFVNGGHVPAYDGRTFVGIGCVPGSRYDIRAVISDGSGAAVEFSTSPTCRSGNP